MYIFVAYSPSEPECRVDRDCPRELSCIDESCQNLCSLRNPCIGNLRCSIEESNNEKKIVACSCPHGLIFIGNGECKEGNNAN